ncbi:MAG: group III truncated hemoglobin [Saprospiraceae bacterium]
MKPDITHRADIERLINVFYEKVQADTLLGPVFNDVANVDWPRHLPVMYNFWEFLLLGGTQYQGNPIQKHVDLHALHPLKAEHFDRWLLLFQSTVDELYVGPVAADAKFRAYAISETWKPKFTGGHGIRLPSDK